VLAQHRADHGAAVAPAAERRASRALEVQVAQASRGVDELTELTMRQTAQLTGGRYVFLTDDSGIGNSHKEPTVPCFFVTKLDNAVLRMVDIELSGVYREPTSQEVLRTAGNPQSGICQLADRTNVSIY